MMPAHLEITYRKGRALAAYYYLSRQGEERSVRVEKILDGILVDFAADGRAIGIEIASPGHFDVTRLNEALVSIGLAPVPPEEFAPLLPG
jgi:hypothetical protein